VAGGDTNTANFLGATVGGGIANTARGFYATIGGGKYDTASGNASAIGGGYNNRATGDYSTVAGGGWGIIGMGNQATNTAATVGGGAQNIASGILSTVPGGWECTADGHTSFAAGNRAKALHANSFVWADGTGEDYSSTGDDQFLIRANGGVGIGTVDPPGAALDVRAIGDGAAVLQLTTDRPWVFRQHGTGTTAGLELASLIPGGKDFLISTEGNVGIGTLDPNANLHVRGPGEGYGGDNGTVPEVAAVFEQSNPGSHTAISINAGADRDPVLYLAESGVAKWDIRNDEDGDDFEIRYQEGAANIPVLTISPTGDNIVSVKVLEITGGADLAEPFEMTGGVVLPIGALVVIDDENPGKLTISDRAYDGRVAGVISGAGGVKPGLTLTQDGIMDGGQKVAISGRVYCLADASNAPIQPGDLLTTARIPGHAMKATDRDRAYGAVIGKAMTALESGRGLVLASRCPEFGSASVKRLRASMHG
jgi:hypothetical protein